MHTMVSENQIWLLIFKQNGSTWDALINNLIPHCVSKKRHWCSTL